MDYFSCTRQLTHLWEMLSEAYTAVYRASIPEKLSQLPYKRLLSVMKQ